MVNDVIFEKNIFKKKHKINSMANSSVSNSSSVNIVRKALKIPTNFDSIAAKQMSNYKHSKAQEMFKERNKKFVDEGSVNNGLKSNNFIDTTNGHSFCPVPIEFLEDGLNERVANKFLNRQTVSSSTPFLFPASPNYLPESFGNFGKVPLFNPHIPPPIYPQLRSTNSSPNNFHSNIDKEKSNSKSSTPNSSVPNKKRNTANENNLNKEIKKEVEDVDEIPSFQSPPDLVSRQRLVSKSVDEFSEDEKNKKKQALLWSLCQEELTVQSSIINGTKRIETIRKKIDTYQNVLSNEEIKIQELKQKAEQLAERRKDLLMSADYEEG